MFVAHLSTLSAAVNRAHKQQNAWTRLEGEAIIFDGPPNIVSSLDADFLTAG